MGDWRGDDIGVFMGVVIKEAMTVAIGVALAMGIKDRLQIDLVLIFFTSFLA